MNDISIMRSSSINLVSEIKVEKSNIKLQKEENKDVGQVEMPAVVYTPSEDLGQLKNYDKTGHLYNKDRIDSLKAEVESKLSGLIETVKSLLESQGLKYGDVMSSIKSGKPLLDEQGNEIMIKVDDETRAKAEEAISEDGYFGVKNTSARLIEFAKIISGDDPSKVDKIKSAIKEGFDAVKDIFGGELPEISQKTYDAVMEGLDKWANGEEEELVVEATQ